MEEPKPQTDSQSVLLPAETWGFFEEGSDTNNSVFWKV